ncbi:MAG: 50S ribosomal protein L4 [Bacteroidales bacterium]|jgi:large subunit ribosomal protein L4
MEVVVYNVSGAQTDRKIKLDDAIFGIEPNDHAIYLDVKQFMANKRQGTHSSKEKSQLTGSTKKLKKQKGTGGARAGSIKSPLFKGGARVFGPHPRDYDFKLNKKLKKLARKSALSYKVKDESIIVLEDFTFETPKTKNFTELLKNFKTEGKRLLLVTSSVDMNILLSSRNMAKVKVMQASDLNTYEILNAGRLLLTESSVKEIESIHAN